MYCVPEKKNMNLIMFYLSCIHFIVGGDNAIAVSFHRLCYFCIGVIRDNLSRKNECHSIYCPPIKSVIISTMKTSGLISIQLKAQLIDYYIYSLLVIVNKSKNNVYLVCIIRRYRLYIYFDINIGKRVNVFNYFDRWY